MSSPPAHALARAAFLGLAPRGRLSWCSERREHADHEGALSNSAVRERQVSRDMRGYLWTGPLKGHRAPSCPRAPSLLPICVFAGCDVEKASSTRQVLVGALRLRCCRVF
eukprot:6192006-Pleurochrysis_carterae.AAC.1